MPLDTSGSHKMDAITNIKCNVLNQIPRVTNQTQAWKMIMSWYLVEYCRNARASSPSLVHQSCRGREHVLYGYTLAPGATLCSNIYMDAPVLAHRKNKVWLCETNMDVTPTLCCSMNERRPFLTRRIREGIPGFRHDPSMELYGSHHYDEGLCASSHSNIYISTMYKLMRFPEWSVCGLWTIHSLN